MDYRLAKKGLTELLRDVMHSPWKTGAVLLVSFLAFVGLIAISTYVSSVVTNYVNAEPPPSTPAKTITYESIATTTDEYGLIHTLFSLVIHTPAGNSGRTRIVHDIRGARCEVAVERGLTDYMYGIASTSEFAKAECISDKPLIDDGYLFAVQSIY